VTDPSDSVSSDGASSDGEPADGDHSAEDVPGGGGVADGGSFTPILERARHGDSAARSRLFEVLYAELRVRAADQVRRMGTGAEIQATELVNEAYLKLLRADRVRFEDRAHFLAVASRSMRQVLVDHVRSRRRIKRGGEAEREPLDAVVATFEERSGNLVELDAALEELARRDEVGARAVDLRFFAGLSSKDTAALLGLSERSFDRKWQLVKSWLASRLRG
jgi:RNA polymerase sigma-70 factor, ECF subfamily